MKVVQQFRRNAVSVKNNDKKQSISSFGSSKINFDCPTKTMVKANNPASLARVSYNNVHNINRKQISFGSSPEAIAENIARILLKHKIQNPKNPCLQQVCPDCSGAIQKVILPFIQKNEPIQMTMAAFPFKASSRLKCISEYPDMAEVISLKFLKSIVCGIKKVYSPGAKLTIYNDGLMFTPIAVNPPDREALKYIKNLKEIINQIGASDSIEMKTIGNFYGNDIAKGRDEILNEYPYSIAGVKQKALDPNDLEIDSEYYVGTRKFTEEKIAGMDDGELEEILKERYEGRPDDINGVQYNKYIEAINSSPNKRLSNKAKDRLASDMAIDTIRRSKAWGMFINNQQPDALRLSCHSQKCGSSKIGIYLSSEHNNWGTPWQLTAVKVAPGQYVFAKRQTAENAGFKLVYPYFKMTKKCSDDTKEKMISIINKKI